MKANPVRLQFDTLEDRCLLDAGGPTVPTPPPTPATTTSQQTPAIRVDYGTAAPADDQAPLGYAYGVNADGNNVTIRVTFQTIWRPRDESNPGDFQVKIFWGDGTWSWAERVTRNTTNPTMGGLFDYEASHPYPVLPVQKGYTIHVTITDVAHGQSWNRQDGVASIEAANPAGPHCSLRPQLKRELKRLHIPKSFWDFFCPPASAEPLQGYVEERRPLADGGTIVEIQNPSGTRGLFKPDGSGTIVLSSGAQFNLDPGTVPVEPGVDWNKWYLQFVEVVQLNVSKPVNEEFNNQPGQIYRRFRFDASVNYTVTPDGRISSTVTSSTATPPGGKTGAVSSVWQRTQPQDAEPQPRRSIPPGVTVATLAGRVQTYVLDAVLEMEPQPRPQKRPHQGRTAAGTTPFPFHGPLPRRTDKQLSRTIHWARVESRDTGQFTLSLLIRRLYEKDTRVVVHRGGADRAGGPATATGRRRRR